MILSHYDEVRKDPKKGKELRAIEQRLNAVELSTGTLRTLAIKDSKSRKWAHEVRLNLRQQAQFRNVLIRSKT